MKCDKCGHDNSRREKYCTECGYPLTKDDAEHPSATDIPEKAFDKYTNKDIIKIIYGKRYEKVKTLFYVLYAVLFMVFLIAQYFYIVPDDPDLMIPKSFSQNAGDDIYVCTTLIKLSVLLDFDESDYIYCAALTSSGERCILYTDQETFDNYYTCLPDFFDESAPSVEGVKVTGMCVVTNDVIKTRCKEASFCSDAENFNKLFGKYTIEVNDKPESNNSKAFSIMFFCFFFPGTILLMIKLVVFQRYRSLNKSLNRLRISGDIDLVEGLFEFAPYNPHDHNFVFVNGLFFSAFDGCLAKVSDIVRLKYSPNGQYGCRTIVICYESGHSQICVSRVYVEYVNALKLIRRLKIENPKMEIVNEAWIMNNA